MIGFGAIAIGFAGMQEKKNKKHEEKKKHTHH